MYTYLFFTELRIARMRSLFFIVTERLLMCSTQNGTESKKTRSNVRHRKKEKEKERGNDITCLKYEPK